MHGCKHADGTPAPCVVGGFAYGPDARDSYKQGNLGSNIKRTKWARGSVVEAAYIMYSNHGGGYSYRLCKQSSHLTEECFQAGHLDFVVISQTASVTLASQLPAYLLPSQLPVHLLPSIVHPVMPLYVH